MPGNQYADARTRVLLLSIVGCLLAPQCLANVCTPLNAPVNGPFPAIVNGLDALSWGTVRVQWTSDASAETPATRQRIVYATEAQWAQNPGSYPQTQGMAAGSAIRDAQMPQGGPLSNLLPKTTYHVMGQSLQGGNWCSGTDVVFTTREKPEGLILPTQPERVAIPPIAMTGTHWVYGVSCGTGGGSAQEKVQQCFRAAKPGDDIGFPPGTYEIGVTDYIYIPAHPKTRSAKCSMTNSTCTVSKGQAPPEGTKIITVDGPNPLNPGIPYVAIHANGASFQVSYDGVNPLAFTAMPDSPMAFLEQTGSPNYIWVHSTAPADQLPPAGVRLGADSLAQYLKHMPVFKQMSPNFLGPFAFEHLASGYYFENVGFTTDETVATHGTGVDPVGFPDILSLNTTNSNIIFDRCAFIPAGPPSRSAYSLLNGVNVAVINSYQSGLDWWEPYAIRKSEISFTRSKITLPAVSWTWPGKDGTAATRQSCQAPAGSVTLRGGNGSGPFYYWVDPATCGWSVELPLGLDTQAEHVTVTSSATPSIPRFTYTAPSGAVFHNFSVLPYSISGGTINNGEVTGMDTGGSFHGVQITESGGGFYIGKGPGPFLFYNDFQTGSGVAGVMLADDLTSSKVCAAAPCSIQYNTGNLIHQRSTVTANPCYFQGSACWNGGSYDWRNMDEFKQGKNILQDGNIFGPYYLGIGEGYCTAFFSYGQGAGHAPDYADSSEWTFKNNTCMGPFGIATGHYPHSYQQTYPQRDIYIHNNLFLVNGYTYSSPNPPPDWKGGFTDSSPLCPFGALTEWGGWGENFIFDHNTVWGRGGCQAYLHWQAISLSSGIHWTNNILDVVGDIGGYNAGPITTSVYLGWSGEQTPDHPDCTKLQGAALFQCLNDFQWKGNVLIPTYANNFPPARMEWNKSQIKEIQNLMPSSYWPAGSTLEERVDAVGWVDAQHNNFRLKKTSPYAAASQASTDGRDIGVDMDELEAAQGKVSNVQAKATSSSDVTLEWWAPDNFACSVDYGSSPFWEGQGSWKRLAGHATSRQQSMGIHGLPEHGRVYFRINCASEQPKDSLQLP